VAAYQRVRATVVEDWLDDRIWITDRDDLDPWESACGSTPGDLTMLGVAGGRVRGGADTPGGGGPMVRCRRAGST